MSPAPVTGRSVMIMEAARWSGPHGIRVAAVRLTGAHRVWAAHAGVPPDVRDAFLVTARGALVGRGYHATVDDLAAAVDLAELVPDEGGAGG